MTLVAFKIVSMVLATIATVIAFTGPTHPDGRPLWHLNFRGVSAAICVVASLACGITAERKQAIEDNQKVSKIDELSESLRTVQENLNLAQEENRGDLNQISTLQNETRSAAARIQQTLDDVPVDIVMEVNDFGGRLLNAGSQHDLELDVEKFHVIEIRGKAVNSKFEYPLFSNKLFRVEFPFSSEPAYGIMNGRDIHSIFPQTIEAQLLRVSQTLRERLQGRWGIEYEITLHQTLRVCAKVEIVDRKRQKNVGYITYTNSMFASSLKGRFQDDKDIFQECADAALEVPEEQVFTYGSQSRAYFNEDFNDFITDFMLTEEMIQAPDSNIEYLRRARQE